MSQEIPASTRLNESVFRTISYILVTLMVVCGALTFGNLVNRYMSAWPTTAIAIISAMIVLDRLYTYQKTKSFPILSKERLLAASAQLIVIIIVVKVVSGLSNGFSAFLEEIPLWLTDFQKYFLTPDFYVSMVVATIVWMLGGDFAEILSALGMEQALVERQSAGSSARGIPPRYRLLSLVFNIGAALVVITALARINLRVVFMGEDAPLLTNIPALEGGGASTLLYFMFALALLSETQFVSLNTRWSIQGIRVGRNLAVSWVFYSLLFLVGLALIAGFLPTSYGLGALALLGYVLDIILIFFVYLMQFLVALFIFLISLPFRLMNQASPLENFTLNPPELPELPTEVAGPVTPVAWWEALKTILIWGTIIAIVIYSIRQYLRQHEDLANSLRRRPILRWLLQIWRWLKDLFGGISQGVREAVVTSLERIRDRRNGTQDSDRAGFINPRRLNPRQRVYFFYLALIRRGDESGLTRSLSQTPYEYASTLDDVLPDVDEDVDAITEAFVEARYTPRVVEEEKANLVKTYWDRIRRALRSKRGSGQK
ncbi:MAG: DUF4129 domain-containing protein [Anaerolineales bacterium]